MSTDEKQRILGWCGGGGEATFVDERSEPGADFSLVLEADGYPLTATLAAADDRLMLRQVVPLEGAASGSAASDDLVADLADLEERRPGPVTVRLDAADDQVVVGTWVIIDGLTKHSFLTAVSDLSRTRRAVVRLAALSAADAGAIAGLGETADAATTSAAAVGWPDVAAEPAEEAAPVEEAAAIDAGEPSGVSTEEAPVSAAGTAAEAVTPSPEAAPAEMASPWASPASSDLPYSPTAYQPASSGQGYQPSPTPGAYGAAGQSPVGPIGPFSGAGGQESGQQQFGQPQATQPTWTPSHRVPPQGMQAWAAPDPNGAVIATLGGHLPVQVTEIRGAWAHVLCSNGWNGWVDGRLLVGGA